MIKQIPEQTSQNYLLDFSGLGFFFCVSRAYLAGRLLEEA